MRREAGRGAAEECKHERACVWPNLQDHNTGHQTRPQQDCAASCPRSYASGHRHHAQPASMVLLVARHRCYDSSGEDGVERSISLETGVLTQADDRSATKRYSSPSVAFTRRHDGGKSPPGEPPVLCLDAEGRGLGPSPAKAQRVSASPEEDVSRQRAREVLPRSCRR